MPWIKPFDHIFGGLNKNKDLNNQAVCPWRSDCPGWVDKYGNPLEKPLPQKLKLIEIPQPMVRLYECQHCHMRFFYGIEGRRVVEQEKAHMLNPGFIGGTPTW